MYIKSDQIAVKQSVNGSSTQDKLRAYTSTQSIVAAGESYAINASQTQLNAYKGQANTNTATSSAMIGAPAMTKDQMVVLSHSMSTEDYHRMKEDGVNPGTLAADEFVTTMDKIKASLAEAGVVIEGYTDQISQGKLQEITGSASRAAAITNQLNAADLPASDYNIEQVKEALEMAASLAPLTDTTKAYLVDNAMDPTINSIYKAQHNSSAYASHQRSGYFAEPTKGYIGKKADDINWDSIKQQVEQVLSESKLPVTEESLAEAKWLLEKSIPVTVENIERYHDLATLTLPKEEALVMQDIVNALVNLKKPTDANLVNEENIYEKAVANKNDLLKELEQVTSTRQLEEIRYMMTTQVSAECIKRGFEIDTTDLAKTVEQLKAIERDLYQAYISDEKAITDTEIAQYKEARSQVEQIPMMPLAIVGKIANHVGDMTLSDVYKEGVVAKENFAKINEKYEQVMTLPTRELGDSIQKAFQNVGAILEDLELEDNQVNQKAVRILGYNQMPINKDNVFAVKEADIMLQRVLEKMTPQATMDLIRKGINPLEASLAQLEEAVTRPEKETAEQVEHYAKFLVQLEHRNEITEDEKEAYIGIYRLMRQVEKSDGAAIGSLVNQGEEVNFKNLLKAVRTSKKQGLDVKVDQTVGTSLNTEREQQTISSQIENYYNKVVQQIVDKAEPRYLSEMNLTAEVSVEKFLEGVEEQANKQEPDLQYAVQKQREYQEVAQVKEAVFETLLDYNQTIHFDNVLAGHAMMTDKGSYLRQLAEYNEKQGGNQELASVMDDVANLFDDYESAQDAYNKLTDTLTQVVEDVVETEELQSSEVRELSFLYKQITLASNLAKEEQYQIPVTLENELTSMNVKVIHNKNEQPKVAITLSLKEGGEVAAHFTVEDGKVSGYLVSKSEEHLDYMKQLEATLEQNLLKDGQEVGTIKSFTSATLDTQTFYLEKQDVQTDVDTKQLYQVAKQFMNATNTRRDTNNEN